MAKTKVYDARRADIAFNMTPMIDVTFQLVIFFILAGSFASLDNLRLEVPNPRVSLAKDMGQKNIVINIGPFTSTEIAADPKLRGKPKVVRVSGFGELLAGPSNDLQGAEIGKVESYLRQARGNWTGAAEDFKVEIRADDSIHYDTIQRVLLAAANAGIEKMQITARQGPAVMGE